MNARRLLGFVLIFDVLAVLILYPRLDTFSCGYLILSTALAVLQAIVNQRFSTSDEVQRLFYAKDIDRVWDRCVAVLGLAELAVFFEYSHWRAIPALLGFPTQMTGLLLCFAGTIWLVWVDFYLVHEFPSHYQRGALMTSGPYRVHPSPKVYWIARDTISSATSVRQCDRLRTGSRLVHSGKAPRTLRGTISAQQIRHPLHTIRCPFYGDTLARAVAQNTTAAP